MEPSGPTDYVEVCTDLLSIRGYEQYQPSDFHMEYLNEDQHYFIVSPKDVVVGKPRDMDDHVEWLIGNIGQETVVKSTDYRIAKINPSMLFKSRVQLELDYIWGF